MILRMRFNIFIQNFYIKRIMIYSINDSLCLLWCAGH